VEFCLRTKLSSKHQIFDTKFLPLYYVHIYLFLFTLHELPLLKCSEEDCLADFVLRKDARLNNPGACSLEFQSVMQILTEHMLKWYTKTKPSTGKGILGTVRAFAGTDEEQGKKTLHRPWQMWMEEINQTLRNALFDNDNKTRNKARQTFQQHIDNVVSTSYGPQFCIRYKCIVEKDQETLKTNIPESLFKE
jgi:hypothetical protein